MLKSSISCDEQYRVILRDLYKEMAHSNLEPSLYMQASDRILVGLADVLASSMHKDVMQWYVDVLAILLVHRGLQVHSLIPDVPVPLPEQDRQLTVLAGDFFSSKYYRILVNHGHVSFVGVLARAIQSINESKAEYRMKERYSMVSVDEHVQHGSKTVSELYLALCEYQQLPYADAEQVIRNIAEILFLLEGYIQGSGEYVSFGLHERIVWSLATPEERKHLQKQQYGQPFDAKLQSWFVKYNTNRVLEHNIKDRIFQVKTIHERTSMITGARFDDAFSGLIQCMEMELLRHRRVVEEV